MSLTCWACPLTSLMLALSSQLTYHSVPDTVPIIPWKKPFKQRYFFLSENINNLTGKDIKYVYALRIKRLYRRKDYRSYLRNQTVVKNLKKFRLERDLKPMTSVMPVQCSVIAQLVEHCTGITEIIGLNPNSLVAKVAPRIFKQARINYSMLTVSNASSNEAEIIAPSRIISSSITSPSLDNL